MNDMLSKVQQLMEGIPEDMRMMIINKYTNDGKPQSKLVEKVLKIIEGFDDVERQELDFFMSMPEKKEEGGEEGEEEVVE